jgi:hypothetical protein
VLVNVFVDDGGTVFVFVGVKVDVNVLVLVGV